MACQVCFFLCVSSHIADEGEDGEEHKLDSAGDAHGDGHPAVDAADAEEIEVAQGVEGGGLQSNAGRWQEGEQPVEDARRRDHIDNDRQDAEGEGGEGDGDKVFHTRREEKNGADGGENGQERQQAQDDL